MTVSNQSNKITYNANGSTTVWTFPFPGVASSNIFVFITDPAGIATVAPPSTYSVSLNAAIQPNPTAIGGSVTYPTTGAPLAVGNTITIARLLPRVQSVSIANQSIIYPPVVEQEFDYLTLLDQQFSEILDRAIKVGISDPPPADLPPVALRSNQQAVFDSQGNLTAGGVTIGIVISPVMVPVVTASTLVLARAAMGVPPIDSPVFTGEPEAPTPPPDDNSDRIATTAFVQAVGADLGVLIPSGTTMLFQQTAAPTGWVKVVTHNDKSLRVVNGTVGNGGSVPFSSLFGRTNVDFHTLDLNEMPFHGHSVFDPTHAHDGNGGPILSTSGAFASATHDTLPTIFVPDRQVVTTASATGISLFGNGGNIPHTHNLDTRVQYVDVIIAQKS
jgi:hypothetical protein